VREPLAGARDPRGTRLQSRPVLGVGGRARLPRRREQHRHDVRLAREGQEAQNPCKYCGTLNAIRKEPSRGSGSSFHLQTLGQAQAQAQVKKKEVSGTRLLSNCACLIMPAPAPVLSCESPRGCERVCLCVCGMKEMRIAPATACAVRDGLGLRTLRSTRGSCRSFPLLFDPRDL